MALMQCLIKFKDEVKDSLKITEYVEDTNVPSLIHWNQYGNQFDFRNVLVIGNFYFKYKLEYKRDGVWNTILDSVYIAKGETFRDTIYY
ncbi:hypothetical protein GCM10007940_11000 [Portibacter lacus]|uniref:Uncharacterized protein n=1 Tax=Portibacter lacus TaxID=1099794 RepID=A0AA37WF08_9BACT|nr:hypothetical protein GCM10007940_11000 [Portibacter lacus]